VSAYLIVDTQIENEEVYEEYKALAKPIAEKYGGAYLARGGELDVRETDLRAFVDSEEYAPIKPLRRNNAQCTLFILDGA